MNYERSFAEDQRGDGQKTTAGGRRTRERQTERQQFYTLNSSVRALEPTYCCVLTVRCIGTRTKKADDEEEEDVRQQRQQQQQHRTILSSEPQGYILFPPFSMMMIWRFLTIASCLLAYLSCCCCVTAQKIIDVSDWAVPSGDATSLPPRTAEVGDTVVFNWIFGRIHTVYIHPRKNCDFDDRILVGLQTGVSYTFTEEDAEDGSVFFSCDAFDHCNFGLHLTINVTQPGANVTQPGGGAIIEGEDDASGGATTTSSQDLCPFELKLWYDGFGCAGESNATTLIWADERCEVNDQQDGPGNYIAYCDQNDNIIFQVSGCEYSNCEDDPRKGDTDGDTTNCVRSNTDRVAPLYAALDPKENPVNVNDETDFVCATLQGQNSLSDTVSYAIFGNCSDFSCTRPSRMPTLSPAPSMVPDTMPPTRAGLRFFTGPGEVSCNMTTSECEWETNACTATGSPGIYAGGSRGAVTYSISNMCSFSCYSCSLTTTTSGAGALRVPVLGAFIVIVTLATTVLSMFL